MGGFIMPQTVQSPNGARFCRGKRPGCGPTVLLGHKSMSQYESDGDSSDAQCPTCGDEFSTPQGMKIHHSRKHGEPFAGSGEFDCEWCGETSTCTPSKTERRRFCSRECRGEHASEALSGEKNPQWKGGRTIVESDVWIECPTCGDEFPGEKAKNIHHTHAHGESLTTYGSQPGEFDCLVDHCDRSFTSEHGMKVHMGRTHSSVMTRTVECSHCSAELTRKRRNTSEGKRYYCGDGCRSGWLSENQNGEDNPQYSRAIVECEWCGTSLERIVSRREKYDHQFCSLDCQGAWRSKHRKGEASPHWSGRVTVECGRCGTSFEKPEHYVKRREMHFCTAACYDEWVVERPPEEHPRWTGGYEPYYGPGWNEAKKEAVRERDNYECQGCGLSQDEHLERHGRKLSVHHKQKARQFDDPLKRNDESNLVSLCQSGCHQLAERMAPLYPFGGQDDG